MTIICPLKRGRSNFTTFGNGVTSDYSYENDDDLSGILHSASAGTLNYSYGRNHAHQLKNQSLTETFAAHTDATFFWKPAGASSSAYAPNHLNQYATVAGTAQGYDANGNLTGDGTFTYEYDEENRLRSATSAGTTVTYTYDPAGRRSSKTVNSTVTRFLSDGAEEIGEYTGSNTLLRRFVYGAAIDDRIAMVEAGGARSYYQVNHQGSTVLLTNQSGAVTETYKYGAYGESTDPTTGNPYRYTGRRLDPETNLYYYRARYYSTALGRFLQTDPIGTTDDMNLYAYVGNNPLNATDPIGLSGREDSGGGNGSDSDSAKQQNDEVSGACARSNNCTVFRPNGTPGERAAANTNAAENPERLTRQVPDTWEQDEARTPVGDDEIPNMGRAVLTAGGEQDTGEFNFAAIGPRVEALKTPMAVAGGLMVGGSVVAVSGEAAAAIGTAATAVSQGWSRLPYDTRAKIVELALRVLGAGEGAGVPRLPGRVPKPPSTISQPAPDGVKLPPNATFR